MRFGGTGFDGRAPSAAAEVGAFGLVSRVGWLVGCGCDGGYEVVVVEAVGVSEADEAGGAVGVFTSQTRSRTIIARIHPRNATKVLPSLIIGRQPLHLFLLLFLLLLLLLLLLFNKILHVASGLETRIPLRAIIVRRAMRVQPAISQSDGPPRPAELRVGRIIVGGREEGVGLELGAVAESNVAGGVRPASAARSAFFVGASRAGLAVVAVR
mmetsp:Transcript_26839/g.54189  ORF Transcript_26839/g.54189 Transcript_26839/m.54189 type:complete len:212 (-) Transcript_26839:355-990(-)